MNFEKIFVPDFLSIEFTSVCISKHNLDQAGLLVYGGFYNGY